MMVVADGEKEGLKVRGSLAAVETVPVLEALEVGVGEALGVGVGPNPLPIIKGEGEGEDEQVEVSEPVSDKLEPTMSDMEGVGLNESEPVLDELSNTVGDKEAALLPVIVAVTELLGEAEVVSL